MSYCGIDVANKTSAVCVMAADGEVLAERGLATEAADLEAVLGGFDRLRVVIEATPLAEWVAGIVEGCGHEAVIIDPRAAKHLVNAKKKTDARDARTLAELARTGWYVAVHRKGEEARLRRSQLQARQGLVRTGKALTSQIRGLLRAHGIRLGQVSEGAFSERVRARLRDQVPELLDFIEPLLAARDQALGEAKRLKRRVTEQARQASVPAQLQQAPGVGPLVSVAFVATIDDPHRFRRGEEVGDYVGLSPRVYQSGEVDYRGRITKEGDGLLRWHLVEAAHVVLTHGRDCALKRWGLRLQKRKGAAKARVAVARKLAVLLWRLWLTGESFDPERGVAAS